MGYGQNGGDSSMANMRIIREHIVEYEGSWLIESNLQDPVAEQDGVTADK